MGILSDLLKNKNSNNITKEEKTEKTEVNTENNSAANSIRNRLELINDSINEEKPELIGTLSVEDYNNVKESVVEIDTEGKTRREIIIGMYGNIKNPITKKRFVIPNLDFSTEDYTYQYAKYMRLLVNKPNEFTKIMNWE